jgi:hypothetical protein
MEERVNLTQDDVLEKIGSFAVKPLFNKAIVTLNSLEPDGNLVLSDNTLSDVQYVMAVGDTIFKQVVPGQKVIIDIEKMMVPVKQETTDQYQSVMQIKVDPIEVDGIVYAIIDDRMIKAIDNR